MGMNDLEQFFLSLVQPDAVFVQVASSNAGHKYETRAIVGM